MSRISLNPEASYMALPQGEVSRYIYRLQNDFFRGKVQQELHICGQCEQIAVATDVIVSELDEMLDAVFLRMLPHGSDTFFPAIII